MVTKLLKAPGAIATTASPILRSLNSFSDGSNRPGALPAQSAGIPRVHAQGVQHVPEIQARRFARKSPLRRGPARAAAAFRTPVRPGHPAWNSLIAAVRLRSLSLIARRIHSIARAPGKPSDVTHAVAKRDFVFLGRKNKFPRRVVESRPRSGSRSMLAQRSSGCSRAIDLSQTPCRRLSQIDRRRRRTSLLARRRSPPIIAAAPEEPV